MTKKKALVLFLGLSGLLLIAAIALAAGPSNCTFPGTTGRAKLLTASNPSAPPACAMNVCRVVGKKTSKAWPCDADPTCIRTGFSWEAWQVEEGGWGSLPACSAWTNTSNWQ